MWGGVMTDTTDIAALREAAIKATQGEWKAEFYDDERGYKTWFIDLSDMPTALIVDNTGIELNGTGNPTEQDELNVKYVALANPSTILALLAQLEAERQRAADLVLHVNTQANMREKAEAEIAALKAKLANPVVLKDFRTTSIQSTRPFNLFDIIVATQGADAEAIIAAGFTVKE
jgi:hypothetical protein